MTGATSRPSRRTRWAGGVVLGALAVALAVLAALAFAWWAALPIALLVGGLMGLRGRWYLGWAGGFAVGFGYWGALLLALPAGPRGRLASQLASAEGLSSGLFTVLGPLLFGVVAAVGAGAVAGALAWVRERRASRPPVPPSPPEPAAEETVA